MKITVITDKRCVNYCRAGHPERPERVSGTVECLLNQQEVAIEWMPPHPAADASILRVHDAEVLERLAKTEDFDEETPFHENIEFHARYSAGAALLAMKLARQGDLPFSLMRPPGHHATHRQSMGFCYLNNMAIAIMEAMAAGVKRAAVFDFDVHHGNGTEDILLNQPGVAFYSVHQSACFPEDTGKANVGNNCFNFPVAPKLPRAEYCEVLARALAQLRDFEPELLGVSAGFDAFKRDPLAKEKLHAEDFQWLGDQIRALGLPTFSLLEGGYSTHVPELVFSYLKGLAGT
jgi:acetoin utilization deacetylase AcuC-like enzyme